MSPARSDPPRPLSSARIRIHAGCSGGTQPERLTLARRAQPQRLLGALLIATGVGVVSPAASAGNALTAGLPGAAAAAVPVAALGAATPAASAPAATAPRPSANRPALNPTGPSVNAAGVLRVSPTQIAALGLRTQTLAHAAAAAGVGARYPATVVVPPAQQQIVSTPVGGLIEQLPTQSGDRVGTGQTLAWLRSPQALDLQREVQASRAQAELAGSALLRDEKLYAEGLIPRARLEATQTQARLARLAAADRQRALGLAGAGAGQGGLVPLKAAREGVVLERMVQLGQRVEAGTAVFRIARLNPLWAELQVPAADAAGLRPGDAVRVEALGGARAPASGQVLSIGHAVDPASQTVLVRAQLAAGSDSLRIGEAALATVTPRPGANAQPATTGQALPQAAVVDVDGRSAVFVQTAPGHFLATPVQVLRRSGQQVEVSGLPAGATVVVEGTATLKALQAAAKP